MSKPPLEELLSSIVSIMTGAGETCPKDYQSGFDWKEYNNCIDLVKKQVTDYVTKTSAEELNEALHKDDFIESECDCGDESCPECADVCKCSDHECPCEDHEEESGMTVTIEFKGSDARKEAKYALGAVDSLCLLHDIAEEIRSKLKHGDGIMKDAELEDIKGRIWEHLNSVEWS